MPFGKWSFTEAWLRAVALDHLVGVDGLSGRCSRELHCFTSPPMAQIPAQPINTL
ncbi:hypothetical protein QWZ13_03650 [Reinekea marina]|uniref:hypothetical protein n=1 Tax=Reinekea marina TaxID=1310421 RepID=UPI0025B2B875|nr:hypothetical protein [Reinekea marina]MDN3648000.1 hypothetical protein [Reinekea marina]